MKLNSDRAIGVVIDIQERLFAHIHDAESLETNALTLIRGLAVLEVPLVATEQYPKGLGPTLTSVRQAIAPLQPIEKLAFSCLAEAAFSEALEESGRRQVILAGIEAHVCVLQTAVDLLADDYEVMVATDCVSSRKPSDARIAFRRMESEGVRLGTYESILMELCTVAGTPRFKAISKLIK